MAAPDPKRTVASGNIDVSWAVEAPLPFASCGLFRIDAARCLTIEDRLPFRRRRFRKIVNSSELYRSED
jgi:hypothetical protein